MRFTTPQSPAKFALMAVLYKEQVGEAIKKRRDDLGLSQSVIADRIETWLRENKGRANGKPFDPQNVSRWERGANMATGDNLEAVAAALETDVPTLLAGIKPDSHGRSPDADQSQLDRMEERQKRVEAAIRDLGREVVTALADLRAEATALRAAAQQQGSRAAKSRRRTPA